MVHCVECLITMRIYYTYKSTIGLCSQQQNKYGKSVWKLTTEYGQ